MKIVFLITISNSLISFTMIIKRYRSKDKALKKENILSRYFYFIDQIKNIIKIKNAKLLKKIIYRFIFVRKY